MDRGAARPSLAPRRRGQVLGRLIVDTSALIAVERGRATLAEAVSSDDDVAIAAVTVAELLVGVELAPRRYRSRRSEWVDGVLESFHIEEYDVAVAREHARLLAHVRRAGRPRGAHDLIVAATARARDRIVLTTDTRGFVDLPDVSSRPA